MSSFTYFEEWATPKKWAYEWAYISPQPTHLSASLCLATCSRPAHWQGPAAAALARNGAQLLSLAQCRRRALSGRVRGAAASALGTLGHAASVVPVLVKQLDDSRGEERSAAAHALDAIGLRVHVAPAILR